MKRKDPTHTSLIVAHLRDADDFRSVPQLVAAGCGTTHQVWQALIWLRKAKVVDAVPTPEGSWWYLLPPDNDQRSRIVAERVTETKPRKRRKPVAQQENTK